MLTQIKELSGLLMGSNGQRISTIAISTATAFLYGASSTSMAFINKIVLDYYSFDYPMFIIMCQMIVTFLIVKILNYFELIKLNPLSKDNLKQFARPCFFYSLNAVMSLAALGSMNLTMYSVVKRNGPLCTMILSTILLKKGLPGCGVISGVIMMSVGCIVAAIGDIKFDLEAYMLGAGSVLSQSLYLIFLQKLSDSFSTPDTLYMNSVLSFPVAAIMTVAFGEYHSVYNYERYREVGFIFTYALLLVMGSFLNFTLFLCNSHNSALTTTVVGTLKSVVQTTMGMFTFGGVTINVPMVTGVVTNLSGGIFYTYAKYKDSMRQKELKKISSSVTLENVENGKQHMDNNNEKHSNGNLIHLHPQSQTAGERVP